MGLRPLSPSPAARTLHNGQLCDPDVNKLLETEARIKVARYCDGYANLPGTTYAFLPCVMFTSGRIHGGFLPLLFILARQVKASVPCSSSPVSIPLAT